MGISWSSRRRNSFIQNPPPPPPPPYYYSSEPHPHPPPPQGYFFTSAIPPCTSYVTPSQRHTNYANSVVGSLHFHPFYVNHPALPPPALPPPPYVNHHTAKKVRNHVNVQKHTLCVEVDHHHPHHHLVSFVFDAEYDGSITIFFFAKEEEKCRFVPLFPDAFEPVRMPFQKGVGQKFCQPSGTGIDLGFFELDDLSKPSPGEDVFPLIICAETYLRTPLADETPSDSMLDVSPHMQITQCVLEKSNGDGPFQIKVVRQILWIDSVRYELRELYGIGSFAATDFDDNDPGKECVICMTEPKDTAVLPCRHMCMCSECAKALRLQSNKCPICRRSIEELIEIKINNGDQ